MSIIPFLLLAMEFIFINSGINPNLIGGSNIILAPLKPYRQRQVISVDVSGSMGAYVGSTNTLLSEMKEYLKPDKSYQSLICSHQFNHESNEQIRYKNSNSWQTAMTASGGTNYNLAISYLANRIKQGKSNVNRAICYTLITDRHPLYIRISQTTANFFTSVYNDSNKFLQIVILNVGGLPKTPTSYSKDTTITGNVRLRELLDKLSILYVYGRPTSLKDAKKYFSCSPFIVP